MEISLFVCPEKFINYLYFSLLVYVFIYDVLSFFISCHRHFSLLVDIRDTLSLLSLDVLIAWMY